MSFLHCTLAPAHSHTDTHTVTHTRTCTHTHTRKHACTYTCTYACTHTQHTQTSISEQRDEFQQLILNVLQREVIPEFKVLKDIDSDAAENFRFVLQEAVGHLCKDLDWLQALTTKQKFCWGIVAACCSKIFVSIENFEWVHSYDKVMVKLGRIYFTYCNGKKLADEKKIITAGLPSDIQHNPSPDVKK